MKRNLLMLSIICLIAAFSIQPVMAAPAQGGDGDSIVIAVSSYPVAGNAGWTNWTVNIASSTYQIGRITRITMCNDDIAVPQTVTFYDNVQSTAALTKIWEVIIGTNTAFTNFIHKEEFSDANPLPFRKGLLVRKSSISSNVTVSVKYK
jgi:hypothetical protein